MGNGNSGPSISTNIAIKAVSEAYLSVTQDIAQSVLAVQVVSLDCKPTGSTDPCLNCIKNMKKIWEDGGWKINDQEIANLCKVQCTCKIEKINLDQNIAVNFKAFQETDVQAKFVTQVMNSIYAQASQEGSSIYPLDNGDRVKAVETTVQDIYSKMCLNSVQESLQSLKHS